MADKGTTNDLAPVTQVTDAEAKDFKLDTHLVKLMWDEPFYSAISRRISKSRSLDLPTAGVCVIDGSPSLLWNPVFFNEMTHK